MQQLPPVLLVCTSENYLSPPSLLHLHYDLGIRPAPQPQPSSFPHLLFSYAHPLNISLGFCWTSLSDLTIQDKAVTKKWQLKEQQVTINLLWTFWWFLHWQDMKRSTNKSFSEQAVTITKYPKGMLFFSCNSQVGQQLQSHWPLAKSHHPCQKSSTITDKKKIKKIKKI